MIEKPWYKRWWGVLFIIFAIGTLANIVSRQSSQISTPMTQQIQQSEEVKSKYIGPKNWKTYFNDSKSEASYKDLIKIDENTIEVMNCLEIGQACIYNHYRFNCLKKQWLQIEVAALPCGASFKMAPGPSSNEWFVIDRKETGKEIIKLFNLACKE